MSAPLLLDYKFKTFSTKWQASIREEIIVITGDYTLSATRNALIKVKLPADNFLTLRQGHLHSGTMLRVTNIRNCSQNIFCDKPQRAN